MNELLELLEHYNFAEIVIFLIFILAAIRGLVTYVDWAKEKISTTVNKNAKNKSEHSQLHTDIEEIKDAQKDMLKTINKLSRSIDLLTASDKDDIKAYITREHHYFCYQLGYIDDYNLDCIEKRYAHYKDEGGNSFIGTLMEELRALPKEDITHLPPHDGK